MAAVDDTPAPVPADRSNLVDCNVLKGQEVTRPGGHLYRQGEHFEADRSEADEMVAEGLVEIVGPSMLEPSHGSICDCCDHS